MISLAVLDGQKKKKEKEKTPNYKTSNMSYEKIVMTLDFLNTT